MSMTFNTDVVIGSSYNLDLQGMKVFYGTCSTAAGTNPKVVTCAGFAAADLAAGTLIYVKFTNTATTTAVADVQMNVNSTGAKNIKKLYNAAVNNITAIGELIKGIPLLFAYNGTYWVLLGADYNSTYSAMSLANAQTVANASPNTSSYLMRADRLAAAIKRGSAFKVTITGISSLPVTKTVAGSTALHEVYSYQLSVPSAQGSDWTIDTSTAGSITVSGTFSGSTATNLTLWLAAPEAVTGT